MGGLLHPNWNNEEETDLGGGVDDFTEGGDEEEEEEEEEERGYRGIGDDNQTGFTQIHFSLKNCYQQTNRPADGQTDPLIEMCGCIQ